MEEQTAPIGVQEQDDDYQETDIFLWVNNLVQVKEELNIELFLFNKNYVVYRASRNKDLERELHELLIDPILVKVLDGADMGMVVRGFEDAAQEDNVLQRTRVKNVEKLKETLNWLTHQESEIEPFVEEEHDFKRVKGVIARITHKDQPEPFYIVKALPQANIMKGSTGWMLKNGRFTHFDAEGAVRIPSDNQLLVLEKDLYVFNESKLEQLFGYNAKKASIAEQKVKAIEEHFKLSFADGLTMNSLIKDKRPLINKLQKIDPTSVSQEDLLNQAEEIGVDMLTDNDGAIIIIDTKDLTKFVNLLNDDYLESPMTGQRYEIRSKKPLRLSEEESTEAI